jgi:hypothetical protein
MVRVGVGLDDGGDLLRMAPRAPDQIEYHVLGAGHPSVDQADLLSEDDIAIDEPVQGQGRT